MELTALKPLYTEGDHFATLYLEGRSPAEDADDQVRLRWNTLREQLASEGAPQTTLDAVDQALTDHRPGEKQTLGRVLVVSDQGQPLLDELWDAALGSGDSAHWKPLPQLGAYVREAAQTERVLLIVAGQQETQLSELLVSPAQAPREEAREELRGSAVEGPHHPREGALAHRRIQRRADEAVRQNAKDFASAVVDTLRDFPPDLVILAGEVQGRTALLDQLPSHLREQVVETARGGATDQGAREALEEEVLRLVAEASERRLEENLSRLRQAVEHGDGVQGDDKVLQAAETGALDTLLLEEGASARREAQLLKEAARTGASLALVPEATGLPQGSAGLLRFSPTG
ncbi:hypothetical protein [Streptomyces sp. NPDC005438]|uniref:baeRF2 domain-containing protein n=1 Tax=Streptomyces sp. NPDC005438 TaxID=3156880 RepID=UPI00339F3779